MEFMAGGTIAKMAGLGYTIREVIATNNEKGTLEPHWSEQFTADARREEARRGAKVLGVDPADRVPRVRGRAAERDAVERTSGACHAGYSPA